VASPGIAGGTLLVRRAEDSPAYAVSDGLDEPGASNRWWHDRASEMLPGAAAAQLRDGAWLKRLAVPGYALVAMFVVAESAADPSPVFTAAEAHFATLLVGDVGAARREAFDALLHIGAQIQADEQRVDVVLTSIVDETRALLRTDVAWLALLDEEAESVRVRVASGATSADFLGMQVDIGAGIGGIAVGEGRTVYVPDQARYDNAMPAPVHRALMGEQVTSVLCAPISDRGAVIGALYAGSREPTAFGEDATPLLAALAAQAGIAIGNARLYEELCDRNRALQSAVDVHRSLTDASLAGATLQDLVDELSRILQRGVRLEQEVVAPEVIVSPPGNGEVPAHIGVPVMAGAASLGTLHALGPLSVSSADRQVLERGATIIALELVKRRAALDVEWRLRGDLLEEILHADGPLSAAVVSRAERFGVDLTRPRVVVLLEPLEATRSAVLHDVVRHSFDCREPSADLLVGRSGAHVVLAIAADGEEPAAGRAGRLHDRAARAGVPARAGTSAPNVDLRVGFRQASAALRFAHASEAAFLVDYATLGPMRFVLDAPDVGELRRLVVEELGPLADYDRREGTGQLMETLRAYVDTGGHHRETAERCHVHANTLKYRLDRIAALLACSPADPERRFRLKLAFELRDVLVRAGTDPLA
jgi:DNA-binding PucR family transcriptional regulator